VAGCCIIWTSFYDDFISFSRPKLVGSTERTVAALFKLLGWIFAEEGDKAQPLGYFWTWVWHRLAKPWYAIQHLGI